MAIVNFNSVSGVSTISATSSVTVGTGLTITAGGIVGITSINTGSISGARNRIINGDMRFDQRNGGASVTVAGAGGDYTLDRWMGFEFTDGAATIQRSGTVPVGFTSSLLWTTTTADATLGAAQFGMVQQKIEGFNVSDLEWGTVSAKPITISFWVRSSLTGTFNGAIVNGTAPADRSYVFNYTINSANTWEYETVTIPGDTTGTWSKDVNAGMVVRFSMGVGSNFQTTAGAWAAGNFLGTSAGTSVVGTLNATWYLTGVQLEVGSTATEFERRSYGQELALCQRYCWRVFGTAGSPAIGSGYFNSTTALDAYVKFPVTMRAAPTVTSGGTNPVSTYNTTQTSASLTSSFNVGSDSGLIRATATSASYAANQAGVLVVSNASSANYIDFSIEL